MLNPHFHNTDPTRSLPISLCPNIMQVLSYKKKWTKNYSKKEQKQHWLPSPGYGHAFPDTMLTQTQQIIQLSKTKLQIRKTKKKQSKKLRGAHPRTYVIIDRSNAVKKQLAIISATNGWVWEGGNGKVSTGWR